MSPPERDPELRRLTERVLAIEQQAQENATEVRKVAALAGIQGPRWWERHASD